MKCWRAWSLLLLLLPCLVSAASLKLVGDSWPPFIDQRLPGNGVAVELVSAALKRAGYASDYREAPWERALRGVQQGDYDVLVGAWYSDERAAYGQFSQPYLFNRIRLIARKDSVIHFSTLADLYPYRIAIRRGYAYSPQFDGDARLQKVGFSNFASALRMLQRGRVNLVVADDVVAQFLLNNELKDIAGDLAFLPQPISVNGLHILVRRSHAECAEIVRRFDAAMAAMRVDGSYQAIMARHGL